MIFYLLDYYSSIIPQLKSPMTVKKKTNEFLPRFTIRGWNVSHCRFNFIARQLACFLLYRIAGHCNGLKRTSQLRKHCRVLMDPSIFFRETHDLMNTFAGHTYALHAAVCVLPSVQPYDGPQRTLRSIEGNRIPRECHVIFGSGVCDSWSA